MNTVWNKNITNEPNYPWLDWIESGVKTYEGRLPCKDWALMKVGDELILSDGHKSVRTRIVSILKFADFGHAFNDLEVSLIPIHGITTTDAIKIYSAIFSNEDIATTGGVIAVGIELI